MFIPEYMEIFMISYQILLSHLCFQVLFVIEIFIPIALCFILGQVRRTKPPTVMTSSE